MKKYLFIVLALLLTCGVANVFATGIPTATDPKSYPTVWTEDVYNGSGSTIQSAVIVEWDFETSDSADNWNDDMCPWVKLANGASDIWTAGVTVYGSTIADGTTGRIIIRGPAYVLEHSTPGAADNLVGTHTNGTVTTDSASANTAALGICVDASPSYGPSDGGGYSIIFVEITPEAD